MLIAEELVLLLRHENGTPTVGSRRLFSVLSGALLAELAVQERIRIAEKGERRVRKGRLLVEPGPPPQDPLLTEAMLRLQARENAEPADALNALTGIRGGVHNRLLQRLETAGRLRTERRAWLGVIPTTHWPTADPTAEREVRHRLHDVLVTGRNADPRTYALVAMLAAVGQAHQVLQVTDRSDRIRAKQRAKEIAQGNWAGDAVKQAIEHARSVAAGPLGARFGDGGDGGNGGDGGDGGGVGGDGGGVGGDGGGG